MLLQQVLNDDPVPLRKHDKNVPKDLQTICLKAMEKDPDKRYQTAAEMAEDLNRYLEGYPILARPMSLAGRTWRWIKRNRLLTAAASTISILSVALTFAYFLIPKELRHTVSIDTLPTGAELAIAPLDSKSREPIADEVIFPGEKTPLQVDLVPGEYLIVARKGTAFHEVTRRVPVDGSKAIGQFPQTRVQRHGDGSLGLEKIRLFEAPSLADSMVRVDGGTFVMGDTGPHPHERTVSNFDIMQDEITVQQFATVRPLVEEYQEKDIPAGTPMGWVSWGLAADCAERLGCRLPTEAEFEFVATNAGTTDFPWGDDSSLVVPWKFGPVRIAAHDTTPGTRPIYGLYSNHAEWTSTAMHVYPGSPPLPDEILTQWEQQRVIRSGSFDVAQGNQDAETIPEYARKLRATIHNAERHPHLGFRCVRSAKPRFFPRP